MLSSKWALTLPVLAALASAGWAVAAMTAVAFGAEQATDAKRPEAAVSEPAQKETADDASESQRDGDLPRRRRGGRFGRRSNWMERFDESSPAIGAALPAIAAYDADGNAMNLADLKGSYAVLIFGCLT